jgi:hypothetical protein
MDRVDRVVIEDAAKRLRVLERSADADVVTGGYAERLTGELLAFLRERDPHVDPQPDLAQYLADGTLEQRLGFRE